MSMIQNEKYVNTYIIGNQSSKLIQKVVWRGAAGLLLNQWNAFFRKRIEKDYIFNWKKNHLKMKWHIKLNSKTTIVTKRHFPIINLLFKQEKIISQKENTTASKFLS